MTFDDMPSPEGESNPVVFIDHGQVRATSRDVAAYFGKRHDNVVRAIRSIVAAAPELDGLTFEGIAYQTIRGGGAPHSIWTAMDSPCWQWGLPARTHADSSGPISRHSIAWRPTCVGQRHAQPQTDRRDLSAWPVEEMRAKTAIVEMYRRAGGPLTAMWAMPQVGFPVPPSSMIEIGRQLLLDLMGGGPKEPKNDE